MHFVHKEKIERCKKRPLELLEGFIIKTKYFPFYYLLSADYNIFNSVTKTSFSDKKKFDINVYQMEYYYFAYRSVQKRVYAYSRILTYVY